MHKRKGSLHSSPFTITITDTIRVYHHVNGRAPYKYEYANDNGGVGDD